MASPPSPPYDTTEDPLASQKMMHGNSIPEPSESPKSQLHDAIERIQSLHKRRAQIKTIYENERQYLDQRSQKTKSSFEGLIVSTEEQIQSINEFPAFDSHPDYTEVNGKLHSVALDTKALFQNVNALSESIIMALDAWYQKEVDKCAYEIKLAEKDYKRSFDTWQDLIKSGDLFGASEPFKSSAPPNPGPSSSRSSHQLQDGPDPHMYASAPVSNPNIPIPHKSDTVTSQHNNTRPQSSRNASIDMGANMSGAMMGGSMNGRGNGNGNANGNANMNGDMNYPPNSSEKRSGGKKKTFSWLSGGSGNGKYIE
ncbi:uncharacterized protein EAF02_007651 [Botrytis sinoallii]|uniref:uncharacterized protein n=1 Tax=Botrytis sinoallii TaxID=1463999 RepID=UPI0018FF4E91|nr:uncharacterized protein EAF02_007651 [Botrytis sinoallii]KAF7880014.1 hypothetical protein EAF02_007651 [Botrytis sinoallii]